LTKEIVCMSADRQPGGHKARHRDFNTQTPEPAVPRGRGFTFDPANPGAVPADSPARSVKDGAEATAAHRAGGGDAGFGADVAPQLRNASEGLSPALKKVDAGRLAVQANGGGHLNGGTKR
jgi:hypothetical protein